MVRTIWILYIITVIVVGLRLYTQFRITRTAGLGDAMMVLSRVLNSQFATGNRVLTATGLWNWSDSYAHSSTSLWSWKDIFSTWARFRKYRRWSSISFHQLPTRTTSIPQQRTENTCTIECANQENMLEEESAVLKQVTYDVRVDEIMGRGHAYFSPFYFLVRAVSGGFQSIERVEPPEKDIRILSSPSRTFEYVLNMQY